MKSNLKLATGAMALFFALCSIAAPFRKHIDYVQPSGATLTLYGEGDEFYAVFETLDGYTVVFDETLPGYCYANLSPSGDQLLSTGVPADSAAPAGFAKHLRLPPEVVRLQAAPKRLQWEQDMEIRERWNTRKAMLRASEGPNFAPPAGNTVGLKTGLTLLIDFSDDPATIPQQNVNDFCNGDNYTGYNNNGSVKKFFLDNSNGKLTYSNVVTIYIRAPQLKSYYNDTSKDAGAQGRKLIVDTLAVMKALPNYATEILPAFEALTTDAQGRVAAFNVFYAGGNGGRWSYGLWPHSWVLSSPIELSPGGKKVYFYQISDISNRLELGTFCHENGHMLCDYPDIYDYDYDSSGGAGWFCLMNSGSSGGNGLNPTQICAYLKRASGWATTIELTATSSLTASLSATGTNFNVFYRFARPGVSTEYFIAECRHKSLRDASLPASGIAIWHIDELGDHNDQSLTPNTAHNNYEVTLVQADGRWDFQKNKNHGDATDLYFQGNTASGYANELSDATSPHAHWWNGSPSGLVWRSFSTAGTTMTFRVGLANAAPAIVAQPISKTALQGYPASFTATASGDDPLAYQWRKDGSQISGATKTDYTISSVDPSHNGAYSLRVTNGYGQAISSNAILTVVPTVPLALALNSAMAWTVDAATPWYGQTNQTHDGSAAARTFETPDGQTATLQSAITGPCTISFWWKVSSQAGADTLSFLSGNELLAQRSGEGEWRQEFFYLPAGNLALKWTYSKDAAGRSGQDCAWLDEVVVFPGATPPFFLTHPRDKTGLEGTPASFSATASGTPPLTYQWLREQVPIPGATSNGLTIPAPGPEAVGRYALWVQSPHGSVTSAPGALVIVPIATTGNAAFGQTLVSPLATNVIAISAGGWHSLALTREGRVLAWGNNFQAQCGVPAGLRDVASISAGEYHSVALKMDRSIVAWGANDYGQCTPPAALSNCVAISAGGWHTLGLQINGTVRAWGDNTWGQRSVPPGLTDVVAISAGAFHSIALRSNGTVVAWGGNTDAQGFYAGQSVVPAGLSSVVAISAGGTHNAALKRDGSVVCWGGSMEGQLAVPQGLSAVAISAGGSQTIALRSVGSAAAWGANWEGQCDIPTALTNVIAVSAGRAHTLVLLGKRPAEPSVLAVLRQPGAFALLASPLPGKSCSLEYKESLSAPAWLPLKPTVTGDKPQLLLDSSAHPPQRFYRIKQW